MLAAVRRIDRGWAKHTAVATYFDDPFDANTVSNFEPRTFTARAQLGNFADTFMAAYLAHRGGKGKPL
jgi:hypothetical protein